MLVSYPVLGLIGRVILLFPLNLNQLTCNQPLMIFFYKQQRDIFIIPPKDDFVRLTTFMLGIVLGMIFWEIKKGLRISPKPLFCLAHLYSHLLSVGV